MHAKLEDWKNGWFGVQLGIREGEIDRLIELLRVLKNETDQHFHLSSDDKAENGLGDITVYVQDPLEPDKMEALGKALLPGDSVDFPKD